MFPSTITLIVVSAIVVYYLHKWIRNYIILSKVPGPPREGILFGNLINLYGTPEEMFNGLRRYRAQFYPIYRLYAVHKIGINILSPEDAELVLSNSAHNEKGQIYNLLHNWLKRGLLTSFGEKWQTRRKILTPAFHFNVLQQFVGVFNEEAEKLVDALKKESQDKPHVDVKPHVGQFTLKTIAETALGIKLSFGTQKELSYKQAVYDIGQIFVYRLFHPWCIEYIGNFLNPRYFEERKVTNVLHTFTKEIIQDREKNFKDIELPKEEHDVYKGKKRLAMLDLLLSAKNNDRIIDNSGIQEEVDTFTFEGHDTTATALGFLFMLLACHKDVQDQVVEEMHQVLGDIRKKPSYTELQNLKYMERCIKESLRLYPSVFFISRTLGEDLVTYSGYLLPKETIIVVHIYDIHHDPALYPDPEKFDPDRFLPENCQNRHPFAYLPFSAGPRNCIGQKFAMLELKAVLCSVLSNFVLEPVDTPKSIVLVVDIVLRTKDGIRVKFAPRVLDPL